MTAKVSRREVLEVVEDRIGRLRFCIGASVHGEENSHLSGEIGRLKELLKTIRALPSDEGEVEVCAHVHRTVTVGTETPTLIVCDDCGETLVDERRAALTTPKEKP